jgi:hypothetical protein
MLNDPFAAQMGLLVMRAEDMYESLGSKDKLDPPLDPAVSAAYELMGYLAASDALVEIDPVTTKKRLRAAPNTVFYGFVACSKANPHQYIVVIRGTGNIWEWIKDGEFAPIAHPASGGNVESGFDSIYKTMTCRAYANGGFTGDRTVASTAIARAIPDGKVTVIGHSLGSALATYLALDLVVVGGMGDRVSPCMFASPHPGDLPFVDYFDQKVSTYTLYNYSRDAVPTVPFLFGYSSLPRATKFTADDAQAIVSYNQLLPLDVNNLKCQHHVVCYAAMLDYHAADWQGLPSVDQGCVQCIVGPKDV